MLKMQAARERMKALIERLSDEELGMADRCRLDDCRGAGAYRLLG